MNFSKDIKTIWYYLSGFRKKLFFICLIALVGSATAAIIPFLYGRLLDVAMEIEKSVWLLLSILAVWLLLSLLGDWAQRYVGARGQVFCEDVVNQYQHKILSQVIDLPLSFHNDKKKSKLMQRFFRSGDFLYMILINSLFFFLPNFLTVIIALAILFYISPALSLVLIILLAFHSWVTINKSEKISDEQDKFNDIYEKTYGNMYEGVMNIEVVKACANEDHEKKKFKRGLDKIHNFYVKIMRTWINLEAWQQTIFTLGFVFLFGLAVFMVRVGQITPGSLITFVGYIALAFQPFEALARSYRVLKRGMPAINRATRVLNVETESYFPEGGVAVEDIKGEIEFRNVHFGYKDNNKVFSGLNFKVEPGQAVALVGASGAGKSTLVDLLQRYYIPQKGKILVDGQDIQMFNLKSYRDKIALVPQEVTLFNASIRENLKYGNLKADDRAIRLAAREANAHEFIKTFKRKYKQTVGERGVKLSVGQKQRVAIARAILRNPNLLILDEATSSLDSRTERLVQQALHRLIRGRTTFIIAHRFSTIAYVDRIIVLKSGKIVEEGSHSQLMRKKGEYFKLYSEQMRGLTR